MINIPLYYTFLNYKLNIYLIVIYSYFQHIIKKLLNNAKLMTINDKKIQKNYSKTLVIAMLQVLIPVQTSMYLHKVKNLN